MGNCWGHRPRPHGEMPAPWTHRSGLEEQWVHLEGLRRLLSGGLGKIQEHVAATYVPEGLEHTLPLSGPQFLPL